MRHIINARVPVIFSTSPQKVTWANREYLVTRLGLHHTFRRGRTLFHTFSVVASDHFLRLTLDTDTLLWQLEEISDGLPD